MSVGRRIRVTRRAAAIGRRERRRPGSGPPGGGPVCPRAMPTRQRGRDRATISVEIRGRGEAASSGSLGTCDRSRSRTWCRCPGTRALPGAIELRHAYLALAAGQAARAGKAKRGAGRLVAASGRGDRVPVCRSVAPSGEGSRGSSAGSTRERGRASRSSPPSPRRAPGRAPRARLRSVAALAAPAPDAGDPRQTAPGRPSGSRSHIASSSSRRPTPRPERCPATASRGGAGAASAIVNSDPPAVAAATDFDAPFLLQTRPPGLAIEQLNPQGGAGAASAIVNSDPQPSPLRPISTPHSFCRRGPPISPSSSSIRRRSIIWAVGVGSPLARRTA